LLGAVVFVYKRRDDGVACHGWCLLREWWGKGWWAVFGRGDVFEDVTLLLFAL